MRSRLPNVCQLIDNCASLDFRENPMDHRQDGARPPPQSPRQTPESAASSLVRRALGLCQTLRGWPDEVLDRLANIAWVGRYERHEQIMADDPQRRDVLVVASGCVAVDHVDAAGQRFLLSMYGPGDITSLIRLLTDAPFRFGFHAREPSTVVHIPCDAMTAVLDAHPILWKDLCLLMLARTHQSILLQQQRSSGQHDTHGAAIHRRRGQGAPLWKSSGGVFCFQPTLSVAIKKLEEELELKIFERGGSEVSVTPLGEEIVRQAQATLESAASIKEIARRGKDPLAGPLRLGVIYTIGPYLLPELVRHTIERVPQMPLMLQENFTVRLLEMLRTGELDCAILAEPFPDTGLAIAPLYDEPFLVAVPQQHALAQRKSISSEELKQETMLLLGTGHCFRDHVLEVCPEFARFASDAEGIRKSFEGSSLETIKHMVASGMGVTLVPQLSVPQSDASGAPALVRYIPFSDPVPSRRVVLAWRRSFTRYEAIAALRNAIYACALPGVARLS
jgi:LysR family hydrogen peroxide-inducible transcriptional activator